MMANESAEFVYIQFPIGEVGGMVEPDSHWNDRRALEKTNLIEKSNQF